MSPVRFARLGHRKAEPGSNEDSGGFFGLPLVRLSVLFAVLPWPTLSLTSAKYNLTCCSGISSSMPRAEAAGSFVTAGTYSPNIVTPEPPAKTPIQTVAAGTGLRRPALTFGDRLKVTFLESVAIPVGRGNQKSDNVVATIFPRADLSSELTVDEDGGIAVPKLGQFAVAGRSLAELQSDLVSAFKRDFGRPCDVEITISERLPIYVLGDVRAPGVFKYSPGMIVMQALANAGGSGLQSVDTSRSIENVRETERLRQQQNLLTRLLIKQARLAAQRENNPNMVLPPSIRAQLSQTTSANALTGLIESAALTLASARERARNEQALAQRQVTIAQSDIKARIRRASQLQDLLAKKQQRLANLKQIASNGNLPQYNVLSIEIDVSDTLVRLDDEAVALAQAERRGVEAQAALERLLADASAQIEYDWVATLQEIADCNQAIESMGAVVRITSSTGDEFPRLASGSSITITRRSSQGFTDFPAADATALQPGDVVRVGSGARPVTPNVRDAESIKRSVL